MENNSFFPNHGDDVVVSFSSFTHKIGKFKSALTNVFRDNNDVANTISQNLRSTLGTLDCTWFDKGIDCELLGPGYQSWQKGKLRIKITVAFEPDEPFVTQIMASNQTESPLDDIRRTFN